MNVGGNCVRPPHLLITYGDSREVGCGKCGMVWHRTAVLEQAPAHVPAGRAHPTGWRSDVDLRQSAED